MWRRRFAGPWVVRPSIWPTAQRWRLSASRVETARRRIAVFQSRSSRRRLDLAEDDVDHPVDQLHLVGHVVVERHRGDAQLVGELAHRQRLEPVTIGERHGRLAGRAPCSAALGSRWLVRSSFSAGSVYPTSGILQRKASLPYSVRTLTEERQMQSRNLAARAGRWSAQHRKTAILGWILFVVLATVLGGKVGQNDLDDSARGSGESKRGDMIVEAAGFPEQAGEQVLVQGKGSVTAADTSGDRRRAGRRRVAWSGSRASPTSRARSSPPRTAARSSSTSSWPARTSRSRSSSSSRSPPWPPSRPPTPACASSSSATPRPPRRSPPRTRRTARRRRASPSA